MANILLSALATLLVWLGAFLLIFGLVGYVAGRRFYSMVPAGQDHMPPHLLFWVPLAAALVVGGLNGLHVAVPQAALAAGDAAYVGRFVLEAPWRPSPLLGASDSAGPRTWSRTVTDMREEFSPVRMAGVLTVKAFVGPFFGPIVAGKHLASAYRADVRMAPKVPDRVSRVWGRARPDLEKMSQVTLMASAALGVLYMLAICLAAIALAATARRDLRNRKIRR